eukprot:CAMPEP_0168230354 /NCGR_PEP_ID=MMETSP0140_2-20121125/15910_1 /TAXON_ID=44445 /ORGANISM="Pseudo-nitzschia australis, Strain 10249 10 AB" /LENGTH=180 /DNA_ID=CAMNT_0008162519 /DNA_START=61 /DNA_END=603 /DNA_ORIENTATION=+
MAEPEISATATATADENATANANTNANASAESPVNSEDDRPSPETFVNNGFRKWQEVRMEWCGKHGGSGANTSNAAADGAAAAAAGGGGSSSSSWLLSCGSASTTTTTTTTTLESSSSAIPIDVDEVIDVLFDPRWRAGAAKAATTRGTAVQPPRFPRNVPLPQMIDVLTDLWEAEGLDV